MAYQVTDEMLWAVAVCGDSAQARQMMSDRNHLPELSFRCRQFFLSANAAGYTAASWTLRADITAKATAKLLRYMTSHGYTHVYPHRGDEPMAEKPSWDINAGYVLRSLNVLPKSGTKRPWHVRQNYLLDAIDYRFDRIKEARVFGRLPDRAPLRG